MPTSISPISSDQSLKLNTTEIGIISNLCNALFKISRFMLSHPTLLITFGLAAQTLLSSASAMNETPYSEANQNGTFPLHHAVETGDFPAVRRFVNKGFDIHAKDEHGMTALDLACEISEQYSSIVSYFESKGARSFCSMFQSKQGEDPPIDDPNTQCLRLS